MRRAMMLLTALALFAAACGGGDDDSVGPVQGDNDATDVGDTDTDPDPDATAAEEADGGGVTGEGGGAVDQGLVDELGLPECPVGAHLEEDGVVEIDFWHPYTALTEEAMQDVAAGFNASQDKIVVNVEAQGSYAELLGKYRESISFDDLPAIAVTDVQAFREMVDSETVIPAQSCVEADQFDLSGIDELVRSTYSLDGALYPGAMLVSTPVLYYNRTHFVEAGLDPDSPPTTMAEVAVAAQAIKDAGVADTPLSLLMQGWFLDTWLTGAGVPLVNADNGRAGNATAATFNTPEAVEVLALLGDMNDNGLILPFSNTPGQVSHYLALATPGTASMLIETSTASTTVAGVLGGTSNLSELVADAGLDDLEDLGDTDLTIDVGVAPFPGITEPGRIFASGGAFYITDSGSDAAQAAAWEFVKYINETDQQKIIHLKGSYLPINPGVVNDPEVQAVWENDAAGQWLAIAYGQLANIDPEFLGPAVGPFTEQREIFNGALEDLLLSGGDPAGVLDDAEAEFNDALADYADANF